MEVISSTRERGHTSQSFAHSTDTTPKITKRNKDQKPNKTKVILVQF